ncbi:MAG TPA: TraR/DksA C4-type zinc finger protein [Clostridia bacterium]|nr:TraR/DksA C4-type zinc finger protein [Clostridia bacterium]
MLSATSVRVDSDLVRIRRRLTAMAEVLEDRRHSLSSNLESMREEVLDELDRAQRISEVNFATALESATDDASAQLAHAIDVLDAGDYGLCEDCGARISLDRLSFRPESTRCLACQDTADSKHSSA